ncbi:major facilitator superfamily domain-containing protein [Aspergillus transmontanensis]|uniref:Major facilitator superfamily domain-containing protein n=1 Tax=Aspergillus transmontanensis TaxID=1034304 RepID=A0A5N6W503_9EURO|nr:major facilitator superfamily domain-containing protein [Aspergillus transmontanensis]
MIDETTPLREAECGPDTTFQGSNDRSNVDRAFLLITQLGAFLAGADDSFFISTHDHIASSFGQLPLGSWLLTAYNMGYSIGLPMYGRVCDVYGYKRTLLVAYALFSVGCALTGLAGNIWVASTGRAVSGIGAAGMVDLISVILTDMAPPKEVAILRSYLMMVATIGATLGAPLGGILADWIGWRWSSLAQSPVGILCFAVAARRLPSVPKKGDSDERRPDLDIPGLCLLMVTIGSIMILCHTLGESEPQSRLMQISLLVVILISSLLFGLNEKYCTKHPLMPLWLFRTNGIGFVFMGQIFTTFSQFSSIVTLMGFFVRVWNHSTSMSGLFFMIIPVAAVMGSGIYGRLIGRSGKYKKLAIGSLAGGMLSFFLMSLRWPEDPSFWELAYPFFAIFTIYGVLTTQFVGLSASIPKGMNATTTTIYYLSQQFGMMLGFTLTPAVNRKIFTYKLKQKLGTSTQARQTIRSVLKDERFVSSLPGPLQLAVRTCFLQSFRIVPIICLAGLSLVLPIICYLPEWPLE